MRISPASILFATVIACGGHSGSDVDATGSGGDGSGSGNPVTINLTLTNRPNAAAMFTFLVAYQDGTGTWNVAPAPSGDTYSFPISSSAYAVAWTCIGVPAGPAGGGQLRDVTLAYFTVAERTSVTMAVPNRCTDRAPTNVGLSGTVSNRVGVGEYLVDFGDRPRAAVVAQGTGAYALETPLGTHDLYVVHSAQAGVGGNDVVVDQVAVARNVAVTAATQQAVDFATNAATQTFPVTVVTGGAAQRTTAITTLYGASGTTVELVRDGTPPFETNALAAAQMTAGDVYDQVITVAANGQTATTTNATATPAAQTYAAPSPLGGATAMVATTTPYPEVHTTWGAYANAVGYAWSAGQTLTPQQCAGSVACTVTWSALVSPGVASTSPSFQMPDLSALAGWSATLQLVTGVMATGTVEAETSSVGAIDFPPVSPPAAGTQHIFVRSDFSVTP